MGEINRHAEIFRRNIAALQGLRGGQEEFMYLELGNFLTDVSQFVDPTAFLSAKRNLRLYDLEFQFGSIIFGQKWADDLLGNYGKQRPGALGEYLGHLAKGAVHASFGKDAKTSQRFCDGLMQDGANARIPNDELAKLIQGFFTQYYPHEHVDMPPVFSPNAEVRNRIDELPGYTQQWRKGMPGGGLVSFLRAYKIYLGEEFSKLEKQWITLKAAQASERRPLMVRLGKLIHAVEDYFFHSNFAEIRAYNAFARKRPNLDGAALMKEFVRDGFPPGIIPTSAALAECRGQTVSYDEGVQWMRRIFRRLRYPQWESQGRLKPNTFRSLPAHAMVYTGGFEELDVYHTFIGALDALGKNPVFDPIKPQIHELPLLACAVDEAERRRLQDKDYKKKQFAKHRAQLNSGAYDTLFDQLRALRVINEATALHMKQAMAVDKRMADAYSKMLLCPGEFMMTLLARGQAHWDMNTCAAVRVSNLDSRAEPTEKGILNPATDNTPERPQGFDAATWHLSDEQIGTHSLMAKDTPASEPLYGDALALAAFASQSVVKIFMQRVEEERDPTRGLDWRAVLNHFLKYPLATPGDWEQRVVDAYHGQGGTAAFTFLSYPLDDKPLTFPVYAEATHPNFKQFRTKGRSKEELEGRYKAFERDLDAAFSHD